MFLVNFSTVLWTQYDWDAYHHIYWYMILLLFQMVHLHIVNNMFFEAASFNFASMYVIFWKSLIAYSDVMQLCITSASHFHRTLTSGLLKNQVISIFLSIFTNLANPIGVFHFLKAQFCISLCKENLPVHIFTFSWYQYIHKIVLKPFFPINIQIIESFYSKILLTWILLVNLIARLYIYISL